MERQNAPKYKQESRPQFDVRGFKTSVFKLLALGGEFGRRGIALLCNEGLALHGYFL